MRPSDSGGADEILLVKRSAKMVFAAGAVVFPGGRVEPADYRAARLHGFGIAEAAGAAPVPALRGPLRDKGPPAPLPGFAVGGRGGWGGGAGEHGSRRDRRE